MRNTLLAQGVNKKYNVGITQRYTFFYKNKQPYIRTKPLKWHKKYLLIFIFLFIYVNVHTG